LVEVLILDAEAVTALAHAHERGAAAHRARAVLTVAHELGGLVRVPAPVLAEVCRGGRRDAAVDRILRGRGIVVVGLTSAMARQAGALLHRAGLDSAHAVDAFVVATAATFGKALIATHDPEDVGRLAAPLRGVRVFAL
jgi:hypothetical protein